MVTRTRFISSVGAALAAGLCVAAITPATAAPQPKPAVTTGETTTNTTEPAAEAKADKRRYCISYEVTGSRIPQRTCKTKADWLSVGVDIDHPDE